MQTKHVEEERRLRLQQAELMALFAELDPDPVFRFDESGKITLANRSGMELFREHVVVGENIPTLLPDISKIDIKKCIENKEKHTFNTLINERVYSFTLTGIPKYVICQIYGSDITKLKLAEEKIQEALIATENSEKLKTYFLLQMSHEIRSPLMAILGFSELIHEDLGDKVNDKLEFAFNAILSCGKRLYRTIDHNLIMAQLLTDNYKVNFENIVVAESLEKVIREFYPLAKTKNLTFNLEDQCNGAVILADRFAFNLMVQNLLDNSIKYTNSGHVGIRLYYNNSKISIDVFDTGIGISQDYLDNLFKPFTQEVMGYDRPYEGSGLGLALVKKLAEVQNIELKVDSEKNKGTVFTLTFNNCR
jgi:signal transduction histidine kinase